MDFRRSPSSGVLIAGTMFALCLRYRQSSDLPPVEISYAIHVQYLTEKDMKVITMSY